MHFLYGEANTFEHFTLLAMLVFLFMWINTPATRTTQRKKRREYMHMNHLVYHNISIIIWFVDFGKSR